MKSVRTILFGIALLSTLTIASCGSKSAKTSEGEKKECCEKKDTSSCCEKKDSTKCDHKCEHHKDSTKKTE
jgi:hypothetical protein